MAIFRGPNIVTDGLVLYLDAGNRKSYPGSGVVCADLIGGTTGGTLVNGVSYSANNNGYFSFDGVDDYITLSSSFMVGSSSTLLFWVNGSYQGYYLGIHSRRLSSVDGSQSGAGITQTIPSNGWNMVGYQGTSGVNNFIINSNIYSANTGGRFPYDYANDKPIFSMNQSGLFAGNDIQITTFNLQAATGLATGYSWLDRTNKVIGLSTTALSRRYFSGFIGLCFIYNRILSASEIQQNYNATKSRFGLT